MAGIGEATAWLLVLDGLIIAFLIPRIVLQRRDSAATLAWILVIVLFPYLGLLAYWVLGETRLKMRRRKRLQKERELAASIARIKEDFPDQQPVLNVSPSLLRLAEKLDGTGPLPGHAVELFRDGAAWFDDLEREIDRAQNHIHMLFYIWEPDRTGKRLRDALVRAAKRGVEVRLLIDDIGSRHVGRRFFRNLQRAGGQVFRFLPVNLFSRHLPLNFRNHRKIVVIDGQTGYTGGMNVGDVYAGLGEPWLDLQVKVQGAVVHEMQIVFCLDWYHSCEEDLCDPVYFPPIRPAGKEWAQLLSSGPADGSWRAIHTLLFAAINLAEKKVWIETPYFVPDGPVLMALCTAALRGVDVRLLLPGRSDHALVLYAGRSFQDELLEAGVRVFELEDTMTHAKTVTLDGEFSTVGSANMDQRSFRLNFESNVFFYGPDVALRLESDFLNLCAKAREITCEDRAKTPTRQRLIEGFARILAPLL
jgi:cardiolipin synthase